MTEPRLEPVEAARLQDFFDRIRPDLPAAVDEIQAELLERANAGWVASSDRQIESMRTSLQEWMIQLLTHTDEAEVAARAGRIGERHTRIGLPQRSMSLAMNVIRRRLIDLALGLFGPDQTGQADLIRSVNKVLDLELDRMLESYRSAMAIKVQRAERLAAVGHVAAGITHDLKNPLGVINTSLLLLRRKLLGGDAPATGEELEQLLARISRSSRQASDLINQLLEFTRIKNPRVQSLSVEQLLEDALSRSGPTGEVRIETSIQPSRAVIHADPTDLSRVLANLIRNAVQSIEETEASGTVRVQVRDSGTDVILEVSDNGPGIPESELQRIFEPLYSTRSRGTGLGLPICAELVEAHGGRLEVRSKPGEGSTFSVRLPQPERK